VCVCVLMSMCMFMSICGWVGVYVLVVVFSYVIYCVDGCASNGSRCIVVFVCINVCVRVVV